MGQTYILMILRAMCIKAFLKYSGTCAYGKRWALKMKTHSAQSW